MAFKQGKINFNNPLKPYPMDDLIYDEEYLCFFKEEFIGVATFTNDPCIGDCFTKMHVHKKRGLEEIAIVPDSWVLKIEEIAN